VLGEPDFANLLGVVASSIILVYVAYWALNVRRALPVHAFRRQALGVALIAIALAVSNMVNTIEAYVYIGSPFGAIGQSGFGLWFVFLLFLFYWTDASVLAVRRSDPRARDTFHWSRLRIVLWAFSLPGQLLIFFVSFVGLILAGPTASANSSAPTEGWIGPLLTIVLTGAILIPLASAVVMLPVAALRTADKTFRTQLIWFAAFAIIYFVIVNQLGNIGCPSGCYTAQVPFEWFSLYIQYVGLGLGAYCLVRSVSSLIPLTPNRTIGTANPLVNQPLKRGFTPD